MSSTSNILSYTEYQSEVTRKISVANITRIFDATTYRAIELVGGDKLKSSDSYATIKQEALVLFEATDSKVGTALYNSSLIDKLSVNGSGTDIIYNGGIEYLVSEDIDIVEERIESVAGLKPPTSPTPPTELSESVYYNLTASGIYTIVDAATSYNSNDVFQMTIYNNSGSASTFNRDGSTVFNFLGEQLTTFDLLDGEEVTLTAVSTTEYNIG